jgi:NADH-quinone oxidoreductase subunit M
VLAIGVYPKPLTDLMEPAVQQLVQQLAHAKI